MEVCAVSVDVVRGGVPCSLHLPCKQQHDIFYSCPCQQSLDKRCKMPSSCRAHAICQHGKYGTLRACCSMQACKRRWRPPDLPVGCCDRTHTAQIPRPRRSCQLSEHLLQLQLHLQIFKPGVCIFMAAHDRPKSHLAAFKLVATNMPMADRVQREGLFGRFDRIRCSAGQPCAAVDDMWVEDDTT